MKPSPSSEYDEQDRKIIKLLEDLGTFKSTYPPELLTARRESFLAQVEQLGTVDTGEELSAGDQEIVKLLGNLKPAQAEYPPHLLAARRSAFLHQLERAETSSVWDKLRGSIQRIFPSNGARRTLPPAGLMRISVLIASLVAAVLIGSLFFPRAEGSFQPSPSQAVVGATHLPTSAGEVAIAICRPDDETPSCPPGELDPSQDLADPGNGPAQPAVSKDARSSQDGAHTAANVNDGQAGASWVSKSANSWVKIDLGKVTTINTVSLQKGRLGLSDDNNPGQFVIAVALSDVYADGDSSNDYTEYAPVFYSEQVGFSGTVSPTETIRTQFPPVQARFVKITFENAGATIEKVGVFMVQPPVLAEQPTRNPHEDESEATLTPIATDTLLAMNISTSVLSGTQLPTDISNSTLTPSGTPIPLSTNTSPPVDPLPSDTPIPLPTVVPPTAIPPTVQLTPASTDTIVVTSSNQTLTFICNGNAAEIRGHSNTVTLLGSCSSITLTGNGNQVFWQFGSPVIMNKGKDNIIQQL